MRQGPEKAVITNCDSSLSDSASGGNDEKTIPFLRWVCACCIDRILAASEILVFSSAFSVPHGQRQPIACHGESLEPKNVPLKLLGLYHPLRLQVDKFRLITPKHKKRILKNGAWFFRRRLSASREKMPLARPHVPILSKPMILAKKKSVMVFSLFWLVLFWLVVSLSLLCISPPLSSSWTITTRHRRLRDMLQENEGTISFIPGRK